MPKFTSVIKGKNEEGRYTDKVTVSASDRAGARLKVEDTRLDDEKVVYTGPGDFGTPVAPARG